MLFQLTKFFQLMSVKATSSVLGVLILSFIFSCNDAGKSTTKQNTTPTKKQIDKDYLAIIISLDTLSSAEYKKAIVKESKLIDSTVNGVDNPFYHYFKGRKFMLAKKRDSSVMEYKSIKPNSKDVEIGLLRDYCLLNDSTNNGGVVDALLMKQLLAKMERAEQVHSKIIHMYYDLLAKAYYQNNNVREALTYAERYYKSHPYKTHKVIEQRYYDISFMLASKMGDYNGMMMYNMKARNLAKSINDSIALARTYDNESQIYSRQGQFAKSLASSKIYFNYLKKTNNLNDVAYNNLATCFNQNNLPDSAIRYYKEGIAFERTHHSGRRKNMYYNGLMNSYKMKGAYAEALEAADSAYSLELRDITAIEAVKVAELHEKYEAEKKDRSIIELNGRNVLYQKIIVQQRWTLGLAFLIFLGLLSFFYIIYKQQQLKGKNKLLASENKRLNIEQKLLQGQLNPHFIFNAIANLQGLISTGDTKESVHYLSSFSKLLRSILEQNRKDFIDLEEEISTLKNYLLLQQMRFTGLFDYQVITEEGLSLEDTLIPPMLIQPFIENAIEHGFRNINYKGLLTILFKQENNQLLITIDDNGIGLMNKEKVGVKKNSLAQIILKERFEVLFNSAGQDAKFEIQDKKDNGSHGVLVLIRIPIIKD